MCLCTTGAETGRFMLGAHGRALRTHVCVLGAHRRALRAYGCVPTPKIRVKAIFIFRQKPSFFFIFSTYPYANCPFFRHPDFPTVLSVEASRCSTGLQKIFFGGTK